MQALLPPATRAGRFTAAPAAVPLSASAIAAPRLPRPIQQPNSLSSLSLLKPFRSLTPSSSSFGSFISRRPWKLPFTVSASSQVSPAYSPSNDESEKAKLDQVLSLSFSHIPVLIFSLYTTNGLWMWFSEFLKHLQLVLS